MLQIFCYVWFVLGVLNRLLTTRDNGARALSCHLATEKQNHGLFLFGLHKIATAAATAAQNCTRGDNDVISTFLSMPAVLAAMV